MALTLSSPRRWQDWGNILLGLWMFASPAILGFADAGNLTAPTAWIFGLAILLFAGLAVYMPQAWEEALNILLGVGLIVSPWAMGYADQSTPMTNAVIVGLLVTALAIWAMLADTTIRKWWHDRHLPH